MVVAIGDAATGVFSTSDDSWLAMQSAGHYTGDRMWRFPLWNYYSSLLKGIFLICLLVVVSHIITF